MKSRSLRRMRSTLGLAVMLLALVVAIPFSALAQTFRGGINGTVTDQSGAVLAGASVEAVETATNVSHKSVSTSGGEFSFQELPLGSYQVIVTASGFQTAKIDKVPVIAGTIYTLPVKLAVATGAETVEVSAAALALDTTSTTQTAVISQQEVSDAPMNGRDFTQFVTLAPGFANSGAGGYGSLNGTRANQINWQIDGIDNNDLWHNIPAVNQGGVSGIAGVVLPLDAVEQFSVQTQASPESGRNPGGSVNLSLKSGTNSPHGSLYYFNRNEAFGSISPIVEAEGLPKQKVRNYNYGLSFGDKIIRDKLFGYISYEHQRFVIGVPASVTAPSTAYQNLALALKYSPGKDGEGNPLPLVGYTPNPVSTKLLALLFPSSILGGPAVADNYISPVPEFGYSYNGTAKIDWTISPKDSLSAHWFVGQGNQEAPAGSHIPAYYEIAPIHIQNYAVVYNHVFSPSLTNQLLAGVNYFNQVFDDAVTGFDIPSTGLITGAPYTNAPNITIGPFDGTGETPPEGRNDITGHLTDDLSWGIGKHQLKLGGELRKAQLDEFYHRHAVGSIDFNGSSVAWDTTGLSTFQASAVSSLADFLMGNYDSATIAIGDPDRQVFVNTFDFFGQDSYQVSPKLNINFGARWDYEGPLHNPYKNLSVFRPSLGGIAFQGDQISNLYDPYYGAFSPRVGFSYQATPKMVIRAGGGLYFDTPNLNPFLDNRPTNGAPNGVEGNPAGKNPVRTVTENAGTIVANQNIFGSGATACLVNGDGFTEGTTDSPCSVFSINKSFRPSYNLNYNLQMEYSLSNNIIAQLGYVGSQGRHLLSILDINQPKPQDLTGYDTSTAQGVAQKNYAIQSSRPYFSTFPNYSFINEIQSIGNSNYNSLQATLRVSNWHNLSAQAAYTWSRNMDDVTAYRGALPQDSTNFKGEYGPSDFDQRNIFIALLSYQVPGGHSLKALTNGWELNSIVTLHGGLPFSILSNVDNSGTNEKVQRAVQIGNPYAGAHQQKVFANWLNPDAFAEGPVGTFAGTSKRNAYYAPGYANTDLSVFKNTKVTEKVTVQFRAEMFNLFNRTNFAPPLQANFNPNLTTDGGFSLFDTIGDFNGAPGIGAGEPFNTQFALKVIF